MKITYTNLPKIPDSVFEKLAEYERQLDEVTSSMNPHIEDLNNDQLQELLWKAKQAKADGFSSPFKDASIYWDPGLPGYRMQVPYKKEFVVSLKMIVPQENLGFDQQTKTWSILESYFHPVLSLILFHWVPENKIKKIQTRTEYEALIAAGGASTTPQLSKEQVAAFTFVAHLDMDSLTAAFKKRATKLHPDAGGNSADFAEFNSAYQQLKKEME